MDLSKLKILNLEWTSGGRDPNIVEPVLSYLELKYSAKIIRDSIWYSPLKILKYRPDVLIVSNAIGSSYSFECAKFASKMGVYVIEMISEGNLVFENAVPPVELLFWGWNTDKILYSDLLIYWSERAKNVVMPAVDDKYADRIVVGGATGFDRYKFLQYMKKEEFILKYTQHKHKKVVGIAGWGFDTLYNAKEKQDDPLYGLENSKLDLLINTCENIRVLLRCVVEKNPDILFILKFHPGVVGKDNTEFSLLNDLPNTYFIQHELPIGDVINICDVWIAYESTTWMEAWLLDKPTIALDPLSSDYVRTDMYKGCVIAHSYEEVQGFLDEYYSNGRITQFDNKTDVRKDIVTNTITGDDGKNHVRTGEIIKDWLANSSIKKKRHVDAYVVKRTLYNLVRLITYRTPLKYLIYKRAKAVLDTESLYNSKERHELVAEYKKCLSRFYEENGVQI